MYNKWIITFNRNENFLIKIYRVIGFIIALSCFFCSIILNVEYPFWIIPLIYSLGMFFVGNNNMVKDTPGMFMLNTVLFLKYSCLPLIMCITGELSEYCIGYNHINYAIFLMAFELISVWLVIGFTGKNKKRVYQEINFKEVNFFFNNKYVKIVFGLIVITIVALLIRYPYLVSGINLLLVGAIEDSETFSNVSSIVLLFWKAGTTWIYLFLLSILKKRESKGYDVNFRLLLFSILYLILTFIGQNKITRWYTVVSYFSILYFVKLVFPKSVKYFLRCSILPFVILVSIASVYKNTDFLSSGKSFIESLNNLFDINVLDAYFSGPVCVNNAIYVYKSGEGDLFSIFYDLIRNMPIVNHLIDASHSTVKIYASHMGRKDQIIPLIGQALIYFGPFLSPILSSIAVVIIRRFDDLYLKSTSAMTYVYSYCAVWTAVIFMLNLTIYVSGFYSIIIPLIILLWLTVPKIK